MLNKVMVGILVGSALSAAAYAGDDVSAPVQGVQVVPMEAYSGDLRPSLTRVNAGLVYDGDVGSNLFTNTANPAWIFDDAGITPGNASAIRPQLITGMALGFAIRGTVGTRDFDVVVEFFDSYNPLAAANTPAFSGSLGSFRVAFTGLNQSTAYVSTLIDLSTLSGGGIQLTDDGFAVSVRFVEPGTNTLTSASAVPVTALYQSAFDAATLSNQLVNGSNTHPNWRDADADGIMEVSDLRTFAWPTHARYWMQLEGDARCPADYNNDGFVDGIDYDNFNNDFETSCGF